MLAINIWRNPFRGDQFKTLAGYGGRFFNTGIRMNWQRAWTDFSFVAFDLEGTGAQDKQDERILELAGVIIQAGRVTERVFSSLVHPGRPIRPFPWIKLKDSDVKGAPPFADIRPALQEFIADKVLVAHNARADWRLLNLMQSGVQPIAVLDTLPLARELLPGNKNYKLSDLAITYELNRQLSELGVVIAPHRAHYDAYATALLFLRIMKNLPPTTTLQDLFNRCAISDSPQQK